MEGVLLCYMSVRSKVAFSDLSFCISSYLIPYDPEVTYLLSLLRPAICICNPVSPAARALIFQTSHITYADHRRKKPLPVLDSRLILVTTDTKLHTINPCQHVHSPVHNLRLRALDSATHRSWRRCTADMQTGRRRTSRLCLPPNAKGARGNRQEPWLVQKLHVGTVDTLSDAQARRGRDDEQIGQTRFFPNNTKSRRPN